MRFALTTEQVELRDEARAVFESVKTEELERERSEGVELGPAYRRTVRRLGELGWLGTGWPKEYGGRGFTPFEQFIVFNEAQRAGVSLPMVTLNTVGPTLMHFGSEEQRAEFLPRILRGEVEFSIGYSEPESGSDLASLRTRAVRDGNDYVINGQKIFTSGAGSSDYIWLAVRTNPDVPKHKGISILIVPTSSPGFSSSPIHTMPGVTTYATYYDDVRIPVSSVVLGENEGWRLITTQLNFERAALGSLGNLVPLVEQVKDWAATTERDGRAVLDDPWVQHTLARVEAEVEAYRLLNLRVAWAGTNGTLRPQDASAVKIYGTELTQEVARVLLQVVGREGIRNEHGPLAGRLERAYRNAVINTFGGGANEIQRDILATMGLGLPRAPR